MHTASLEKQHICLANKYSTTSLQLITRQQFHLRINNSLTGAVTSSNSSVILRMISAFCMFLNISILTVPGYRTVMTGFIPDVWHRYTKQLISLSCSSFASTYLCTLSTGWKNWWGPAAPSLCPVCRTRSTRPPQTVYTQSKIFKCLLLHWKISNSNLL